MLARLSKTKSLCQISSKKAIIESPTSMKRDQGQDGGEVTSVKIDGMADRKEKKEDRSRRIAGSNAFLNYHAPAT